MCSHLSLSLYLLTCGRFDLAALGDLEQVVIDDTAFLAQGDAIHQTVQAALDQHETADEFRRRMGLSFLSSP